MENVIKFLHNGRLTAFVKYNDHLNEVLKYKEKIAGLKDDLRHKDDCLKQKNILLKNAGCDPDLFKNTQKLLDNKIDTISSLHEKIRKQKSDIEFFRAQSKFYHDKLINNRID